MAKVRLAVNIKIGGVGCSCFSHFTYALGNFLVVGGDNIVI